MPPPGGNLAAASPGSSRALDGKRGIAAGYQYPHATTLVPVSLAGGLHSNPPPDPRAVGRIARLISHAADHRGRGRVSPRPGTYRSRRGERACSLAWHTRSVPSVLPWASCVRIHARGAMRDHPDPGLRLLCSRRSVEPEVSGFPRTPGLRCTTERPDRESTQAGSSSHEAVIVYARGALSSSPESRQWTGSVAKPRSRLSTRMGRRSCFVPGASAAANRFSAEQACRTGCSGHALTPAAPCTR